MDLFNRKCISICFKGEDDSVFTRIKEVETYGMLTLDGNTLKYEPVDHIDKENGYILIEEAESKFFRQAKGRTKAIVASKFYMPYNGMFLNNYNFSHIINVEHTDPTVKVSREAMKALSNIFQTTQLFNDVCIVSNDVNTSGGHMLLLIPDAASGGSVYSCVISNSGHSFDEYLQIERNQAQGDIVTGCYYKNGEQLFVVKTDNIRGCYETAIIKRYIFSAYACLNPDECLGIKYENNGRGILLAASVNDGIKIREIPDFNVYQIINTSLFGRPPFFVIKNGMFHGHGDITYSVPEPKDGDYLSTFIDWANVEGNLFTGPQGMLEAQKKNTEELILGR